LGRFCFSESSPRHISSAGAIVTYIRHISEGGAKGRDAGAVRATRPRNRWLVRILPGSVVVFAAFTLPELSAGAGDGGGNARLMDPAEPVPAKALRPIKPGLAVVKPELTGVRYAAILDLGLEPPQADALVRPVATFVPGDAPVRAAAQVSFDPASASVNPAPARLAAPSYDMASASTAALLPPVEIVSAPPSFSGTMEAPVLIATAPQDSFEAPWLPLAQLPQAALAPWEPTVPPTSASVPATSVIARSVPTAAAPAPASALAPAGRAVVEPFVPAGTTAAAAAVAETTVTAPGVRPPVRAAVPPSASSPTIRPAATSSRASARAMPAPAPAPLTTTLAVVAKPAPPLTASAASKPVLADFAGQMSTRIDGMSAGTMDFQQTSAGLKVRLGAVAEVLGDRLDAAMRARIRASNAGNAYLSLAELQGQGIPISYDPVYDEFNIGLADTRPRAARKVHMDQISAPERGAGSVTIGQVPRGR